MCKLWTAGHNCICYPVRALASPIKMCLADAMSEIAKAIDRVRQFFKKRPNISKESVAARLSLHRNTLYVIDDNLVESARGDASVAGSSHEGNRGGRGQTQTPPFKARKSGSRMKRRPR